MSIARKKLDAFSSQKFSGVQKHYETLKDGQSPEILFITCSDSRIVPNQILDEAKAGEVFVIRNAGNIVPPLSEGITNEALTIEYAVSVLKVKEVVVCGHVSCGAMNGILNLDTLTDYKCIHGRLSACSGYFLESDLNNIKTAKDSLPKLIELNVKTQIEHLKTYDFINKAIKSGDLKVFGWVYDFVNAKLVYEID